MRGPARPLTALALAGALSLGLAACGGGDGGSDAATPADADVQLTGTDALKFDPNAATVDAGEFTVSLTAEPAVNHNFVIDGEEHLDVAAGSSDVATLDLEAGEYTFYCNIPGHREAGMEGTLTVE